MDIIGIDGILKTSKDFSKMLSFHYQVNNDLMNDDASSMTHMVKSRYVESKQFYSFLKNEDWISLDQSNQRDIILAISIF